MKTVLWWVLVVLLILSIYFIPTGIALARRIPSKLSLFLINLFLGWSVIGWVVALAMSVRSRLPDTGRAQHAQF